MSKPHQDSQQQPPDEPSAGERLTGLAGLALLIALLGYLLYHAVFSEDRPPDIAVEVLGIEQNRDDYLVRFAVINHGDQTAASLQVEGELRNKGLIIEHAETRIDYAPADSAQNGGLFFRHNPRDGELQLHVSGYQKP